MNRVEIIAWLTKQGVTGKSGVFSYWSVVRLMEKLRDELKQRKSEEKQS